LGPLERANLNHWRLAEAFVENVILVYELLQVVLSDCGANFLNDTFVGICKLLGIKKIKTNHFIQKAMNQIKDPVEA
jgi:hypothetical protein